MLREHLGHAKWAHCPWPRPPVLTMCEMFWTLIYFPLKSFFLYTVKSAVFWELTLGHFLHNSPLFASARLTPLLSWGGQGTFKVNHLAVWGISVVSRGRTQGHLPTSSTTQAFKGEGMKTHCWFSQIQFEPFFPPLRKANIPRYWT